VRLVQVIIPAGKRETVLAVLDEEDIDYVVTDETSGREYTEVAYFPLPTEAVEPVLARLRDVGLDDEAYTVVLDARTVVSRKFDRLKEEYAEREESDGRIAREELRATAEDLLPSMETYVVMSLVSAVVATAGLLLDSPAVVVGSMVIAPLIGPAMAATVGTVIDDGEMFVDGVKLQALGFGVVVVASAAFAGLVKVSFLVPPGLEVISIGQVRERLSPDFLSLAVALGAGTAGAYSLSSGVSASLVGVMIAVALVPPAATVGIGIAWALPGLVLGASVLALVNALSINLAGIATLWYSGYRPEQWFRLSDARQATVKRIAVLLLAIAVLSVFLGGVTYDSFRNARAEEAIRDDVETAVNANDELQVLDMEVEYEPRYRLDYQPQFLSLSLFRRPSGVIVTVGTTSDTRPQLADRIYQTLRRDGYNVTVQVRYVAVERTRTSGLRPDVVQPRTLSPSLDSKPYPGLRSDVVQPRTVDRRAGESQTAV
jgi:uncharacterized hydrophobic protein (TIGR00341 family)